MLTLEIYNEENVQGQTTLQFLENDWEIEDNLIRANNSSDQFVTLKIYFNQDNLCRRTNSRVYCVIAGTNNRQIIPTTSVFFLSSFYLQHTEQKHKIKYGRQRDH